MHFFIFIIITCAIVTHARLQLGGDSCFTSLKAGTSAVSESAIEIDKINLMPSIFNPVAVVVKIVQFEENSLLNTFEHITSKCCEAFGAKNSDNEVEQYLSDLSKIVDTYTHLLSSLKRKKPLSNENVLINKSVKDLIGSVGADATKLLNCVYLNATPKRKAALSALGTKFSEADTDIKILYGV